MPSPSPIINHEIVGMDVDVPEEAFITLVANDGTEIQVEQKYARMSELIEKVLTDDPLATSVSCTEVDGASLEIIVKYMKHHKEAKTYAVITKDVRGFKDPTVANPFEGDSMYPYKPSKATFRDTCKLPWDADLLEAIQPPNTVVRPALLRLVHSAEYIGIPSLLHVSCAAVALLIKGKTVEDAYKMMGGIAPPPSSSSSSTSSSSQSEVKETLSASSSSSSTPIGPSGKQEAI